MYRAQSLATWVAARIVFIVGEGEHPAVDVDQGIEGIRDDFGGDDVTVLRGDLLDLRPTLLDAPQTRRQQFGAGHVVLMERSRGVDDVGEVMRDQHVRVGDEPAEQVGGEQRSGEGVVGHHRTGEVQVRRELELQVSTGAQGDLPAVVLNPVVVEPVLVVLQQRLGPPLSDHENVIAGEQV
jgi:hypothetical protein